MSDTADQRPPVAVGHVRLNVKDVGAAARWLETVGLRPIVTREEIAVLELRGGTHVVVRRAEPPVSPGAVAPFDLMVDDVDATRNGLAELLRTLGYAACAARNGAEALEMLRAEPRICAVVLDLRMPGTSGYWFREQQLNDPAIAGVPVIIFTGAGKQDDIVRLKVNEVLVKPLSVDRLLEAISRCCNT